MNEDPLLPFRIVSHDAIPEGKVFIIEQIKPITDHTTSVRVRTSWDGPLLDLIVPFGRATIEASIKRRTA